MFEDRRRLIIIGLALAIVIVVAVILWWIFRPQGQPKNQAGTTPQVETGSTVNTFGLPPTPPERLEQEKKYPLGLKQLAMAFAERYGSYSTDEPKKNIQDLESQMTAALYKTEIAKKVDTGATGFSGYSVKALAADLLSVKADTASVLVKTQVTQTNGNGGTPNVYYRNLQLGFVKAGDQWLVNSVKWQ